MKPRVVTRALLRTLPLPSLDDDGDKESRGRILAIGGSTRVPGALLLTGVAALRAGAGKLQLATVRAAALPLGIAVPEALVIPLPTARDGEIARAGAAQAVRTHARSAHAVVVGPGMSSDRAAAALVAAIARSSTADQTIVLDGAAVVALRSCERAVASAGARIVVTPHAGEMATLLGVEKAEVERDASGVARAVAERFGATVVLKGAETWIADAAGSVCCYRGGGVGLGTSGSGDTLAGIVGGLAARGAEPMTAAVWGVWAHGSAGARLTRRVGRVGFLARELLAEVPRVLRP